MDLFTKQYLVAKLISVALIFLALIKREFFKKASAYIKDFCTYKKRYNVFIDFFNLAKVEGCDNKFRFRLYIKNNTYSHIRIDRIESDRGEIVLLGLNERLEKTIKSGNFKKGFFIEFDKSTDINGLYLEPDGYQDTSDSRSNFYFIFIGNERPKIVLKYKIIDSVSKNNSRESMARVAPIYHLER